MDHTLDNSVPMKMTKTPIFWLIFTLLSFPYKALSSEDIETDPMPPKKIVIEVTIKCDTHEPCKITYKETK